MEREQKSISMKRVGALINNLKTPTEQNLAAALLVALVHRPDNPKPKRKQKTA